MKPVMSETQGPMVKNLSLIFAVACSVAVVLRLWSRSCIAKCIGADDYLIGVAFMLSWSFVACTVVSVHHGLGSHYADVLQRGLDNMIAYQRWVWLSSIFYNTCLGVIKLSVLALYRRLEDPKLGRASLFMMFAIGCQAGAHVLVCILQCSPVEAAYNLKIPSGGKRCININAFYLANAVVNISTDIMTYTLPLPLVMRLRVPRRQKISLGIILGLGLFACVSSIVRLTYIPPMLKSEDPTWVISGAMYWSAIEINVGIIAASIPSFKVIAKRYAPRLLGSAQSAGEETPGTAVPSPGNPRTDYEEADGRWGTELQNIPRSSSEEALTDTIKVQTSIEVNIQEYA